MDLKKLLKIYNRIISYIETDQLKDAIDDMKSLAGELHSWKLTHQITEVETNYKYMIHYLVEGNKDPKQTEIHQQIIRQLYDIADQLVDLGHLNGSPLLYYEKRRMATIEEDKSIGYYREKIAGLNDMLSVVAIIPEGGERELKFNETKKQLEQLTQSLFYSVFASPRSNSSFVEEYQSFMNDDLMPLYAKSMITSALTMSLLQRFDDKKVGLLLDSCEHSEPKVAIRAITGIVPLFIRYTERWKHYNKITSRVEIMSENDLFVKRLMNILIQYIQAHETEELTRKLTEEIIPEMMKLSPMIGNKINLEEWMGETNFEEKNPEWQKILDEAGLSDKLQEFSELQLGGADVFHSTFSNLKMYPFFSDMSNWFLPFDKHHTSLTTALSDRDEASSLLSTMLSTPMMCNSDKYSFCYSIMSMPEQYRKMMVNQLDSEAGELKKMAEEELVLNPNQKEEAITKQYIQDLYRFFKLYSRKTEFYDIFGQELNYHKINLLAPITSEPKHLKRLALYYFDKNNLKEALEAYQMLTEQGVSDDEIWQKIGYSHQMAGDINQALEAYLKAELINPNNSWVLRRIASCYRLLKQPESALQYFRRLDQINPDNLSVQLNIGHCFLELGEYDEALNYYFKVDLMSNENRRAWRSIAWCSFLSKKYDTSTQYYQQIIDNSPNAHDYLNAGHVALSMGNKKEAVKHYTAGAQLTQDFKQFEEMFRADIPHLEQAEVDTRLIPLLLDKVKYELE